MSASNSQKSPSQIQKGETALTVNRLNLVDDLFKQTGEFGLYQALVFVLVGLTACIPATLAYNYVFISGTPEFRCKIPNLDNDTYEIASEAHRHLVNLFVPRTDENEYEKCKLNVLNSTNTTIKCDSYVFSKKYYTKTIVTDWQLVCDNAPKKSTYSTLYFAGTYAVLLSGILSDKIGRKKTAYLFIALYSLVSILSAILVNIENMNPDVRQLIFAILRFFAGVSSNVYSIAVVLAVEISGPTHRVLAANVIYYFYIFGEYLTALICYFTREYPQIYIVFASISVIYVSYFWLVPESPRWLMSRNRTQDAYNILKKIAKSNKKVLPELHDTFLLDDSKSSVQKSSEANEQILGFCDSLKMLFQSKKLLIRTLAITFNWLANTLVYYGLSLGTGELAGDPYVNFTLSATVELFAIICSQFAFNKYGRKIPYVINMAIAGLSLLLVIFVPKSNSLKTIEKLKIFIKTSSK